MVGSGSRRRWSATGFVLLLVVSMIGAGCAGNARQARGPVTAGGNPSGAGAANPATETTAAAAPDAGAGAAAPAAGATDAAAPAGVSGSAASPSPSASGSRPAAAAGSASAPSPDNSGQSAAAGAPARAAASSGGRAPSGQPGAPAPGAPAPGTPAPAPTGPGTTTGVTASSVTVGLFYAKTGFYSGLLRNAPAVLQAAFDEAGPINGRKVILKTYDDGSEDAGTIQVEEKRAKDESFGFVSLVSESNATLAPLANSHKVPAVVGDIDGKLAEPLASVFGVFPFWSTQAVILPSYIKYRLNAANKRIGIVYEGTSTAKATKEVFKAKAKEYGFNIVYEQPIAVNQSTCANEVSNLQAHQVELVLMLNGPLGAICMLRDARALGYRPMWTGVGPDWNFKAVSTATAGGAEGTSTLSSSTTLETPAGKHYSELMRKAAPNSGADDDDLMLMYYGLAKGFLEGLRRTGPNLTRENFVHTFETAMNGYDSGITPPPTYAPGHHYAPLAAGVTKCCNGNQWFSPTPGWFTTFEPSAGGGGGGVKMAPPRLAPESGPPARWARLTRMVALAC